MLKVQMDPTVFCWTSRMMFVFLIYLLFFSRNFCAPETNLRELTLIYGCHYFPHFFTIFFSILCLLFPIINELRRMSAAAASLSSSQPKLKSSFFIAFQSLASNSSHLIIDVDEMRWWKNNEKRWNNFFFVFFCLHLTLSFFGLLESFFFSVVFLWFQNCRRNSAVAPWSHPQSRGDVESDALNDAIFVFSSLINCKLPNERPSTKQKKKKKKKTMMEQLHRNRPFFSVFPSASDAHSFLLPFFSFSCFLFLHRNENASSTR